MVEEVRNLRESVTGFIDDFGELLGKLVEAPPSVEVEDHDAPDVFSAQIRQDGHLQSWFAGYHKLRQRNSEEVFNVAVLALTKSG